MRSIDELKAAHPDVYANTKELRAESTGNPVADLDRDLRKASDLVAEYAPRYPDKTVAIVVSPTTYLMMGAVAIGIVNNTKGEDKEKNAKVALNVLKGAAIGGFQAPWGGTPVFVDERADYINVGILTKREYNEDGRASDGSYRD